MPATPYEIQRWLPNSFEQIAGNRKLKHVLIKLIQHNGYFSNVFISGNSRNGKTATVKTAIRTLVCENRAEGDYAPCDACHACQTYDLIRGEVGLHAERFHNLISYFPVDCREIKEAAVRDLLSSLNDTTGLRIVYLDEAQGLARYNMDQLLLKPLEEMEAVWIASTATPEPLDRMFKNRFAVKVETELPSEEDFSTFIRERCTEFEIAIDNDEILLRLAARSECNVGYALNVLASAAGDNPRILTRQVIEEHRFHEDEV